jgi:transposase
MDDMSERIGFEERKTAVHLLRSGLTVAEVVEQLKVSASWVYKWHGRYKQGGWGGLKDRSRAPKHRATVIADEVKRAILQVRSELEEKAASKQPGDLSYIGAGAIRSRMKQAHGEVGLCSISSIERILKAAGVTHPQKVVEPPPIYPELRPSEPQQLIQVDIVPHFLPGGDNISCFNAIDVVSRHPTGEQHPTKSSTIAAFFPHSAPLWVKKVTFLHLWAEQANDLLMDRA